MTVRDAMIVAGGRGTRLAPLTDTCPKPLLPLVGTPFLVGQLQRLGAAGITRAFLVVGADTQPFEPLVATMAGHGMTVVLVPEPTPLDTAGGVRSAIGEASGPVVVCNGDVLTDVDVPALVAAHTRHGADAEQGHPHWNAWRVEPTPTGHLAMSVAAPGGESLRLESPLPGAFNAANALGAYVCLVAAGIDGEHARQGLLLARSVPGRMERIGAGTAGFPVFVDYAHTPDAVQRVVAAARDLALGSVIVVMGCGGDRDRDKRPRMGEIAATGADAVIVTDDNPRSEDPAQIRSQVLAGVPEHFRSRVREIADRREAIRDAVAGAQRGDVVLVLGKGHEQGQEVNGVVTPFDDRVEALEAIRQPGVARLDRS